MLYKKKKKKKKKKALGAFLGSDGHIDTKGGLCYNSSVEVFAIRKRKRAGNARIRDRVKRP